MFMGRPTGSKSEIRKARPPLRIFSPLAYWICWIFVLVNAWLFIALCFIYKPITPLLIVNEFLTYELWGILFLYLGLQGAYALVKNDWSLIRLTLLTGIVIKVAWEITLIIRTVVSPHTTILVTVLWGFFTLVQVATYIFFLPPTPPKLEEGHGRK